MAEPQAVALYARVSTDEQAREGLSIEAQLEKMRAYAKAMNYEVKREFTDTASGGDVNRPAFQEMVALLKNKRRGWGRILAIKIDRVSRSALDLLEFLKRCDRAGVDLTFVQEQIDTSTSAGKLMFTVLGAIAEFERTQISTRTSTVLQYRKSALLPYSGRTPFAFRREGGRLIPDPDRMRVVKHIRALRAKGLTFQEIIDDLNKRMRNDPIYRPALAKRWHREVVRRILKQEEFYSKWLQQVPES